MTAGRLFLVCPSWRLQTLRHFFEGICKLIDIEVGVTEEELVAGDWRVFFVVFAEGGEMDALLGKAGGKVGVTALGIEFEDEVESAVLLDDR